MKRWVALVVANLLALGSLAAMSGALDQQPWWLLAALVSLGLPMSLLLLLTGPDPIMLVLLVTWNPIVWAGLVEWMLRRYVDRPKDFPGE